MRRRLIAGNWKLNPTNTSSVKELTSSLVQELNSKLNNSSVEVALCAPFVYIPLVSELLKSSSLSLGAQDCYFEEKGAFTGEISPAMLKEFNVKYVILGHSERRTLLGETDALIAKKSKAVIKAGLTVILCVGESEDERNKNLTDKVVQEQLKKSLDGIETDGKNLVIAYEPIWAIGTGKTCSSEEANRVCALIRTELGKLYSPEISNNIIVQYGGSVKASTIEEQIRQSDIDGALVGGASLLADEFAQIALKSLQ